MYTKQWMKDFLETRVIKALDLKDDANIIAQQLADVFGETAPISVKAYELYTSAFAEHRRLLNIQQEFEKNYDRIN